MTTPPSRIDIARLQVAIDISRQCQRSAGAFSVGAAIFDSKENLIATGYSREIDSSDHAEEVALRKAQARGATLDDCTMYSSLEPCGQRLSGKTCCADLIIRSGIRRVIFALREPPLFVAPHGMDKLHQAGIEVVVVEGLGPTVADINAHLIPIDP